MARIDADAHVDETDSTWDFLEADEARFKPVTLEAIVGPDRRWSADGLELRRPVRDVRRTGVSDDSGQLLDVQARLAHLDELRIDLQVIYPTTFIRCRFAGHEELELALTRAYNRWIAARTAESEGRLRWVAMLPLLSIDAAVKELFWATEHGACGFYKKGFECDRSSADPYFYPLYEAAADLDVPVCIHTGVDTFGGGGESPLALSPSAMDAVRAFNPLVNSGILEKLPNLRVGFIEAGASWVPFVMTLLAAGARHTYLQAIEPELEVNVDLELFSRLGIYVACQSQDDLAYLLRFGLQDQLLVGTDYTHADQSAELRALDRVERQAEIGVITVDAARKILDENPRRFYGL